MVELVSHRLIKQRRKSGRPPKLTVEDQVLLTLEYWREYRTLFHLATSWGLHEKGRTPQKKPHKSELTDEQKQANRELARRRVIVEHVIRSLKIFRILAERYRNRRQRFSLRFNLIAGLYNYELSFS
jgi:hypothetical protein